MKGLEQRAREYTAKIFNGATPSEVVKAYIAGATEETRELKRELEEERFVTKDLKKQIEKLIDFVLSKIECCDVCPITDTCINSEGTCPYAGILAKGEEEVTREWLMQFILRR